MKIDRLIGILSILLQQDQVTAPYLAEKFEVSRRTINRDIEALCKAGIPVATFQGKNGGISIMEGYKVDRTLLTSKEMQSILTGLRSLDSISGTNRYQQLMDKLSAGNKVCSADGTIMIDLASYFKSSLAPKIELIQKAIEDHRRIRFTYYSPKGEGIREIEPYLLVFQWTSWYVWGYCLKRQDFRLFKLNRMLSPKRSEEPFEPRERPPYRADPEEAFPPAFKAEILFEAGAKWRLIEEYGPESFTQMDDGRLLFQFGFADRENLFSWLLSFGGQAKLLKPDCLREELGLLLKKMAEQYSE